MKPSVNSCNQVKFVVSWIGVIALTCVGTGTFLLATGYQSGELLIGIAGSMGGALGGMLAMRSTTPTTPSGAVAVETTNSAANPLPVTETETQP